MYRKLYLFLLLFLLCPFNLRAKTYVVPSERVSNDIQIRANPDAGSLSIARLAVEEQLEFLGSVPYWNKVRISPRKMGYDRTAWSEVSVANWLGIVAWKYRKPTSPAHSSSVHDHSVNW